MTLEHVDVFVIGGGGTGSDLTWKLSGAGLRVALAERDKLGGECANYGCDPTKAMLKAARVAASARRAGEFGIRVGSVDVDFRAVMARVAALIAEETKAGGSIYSERGALVFLQEALITDEHRVELADGTVFEADRIVLATGSEPVPPPIDGLDAGGYWTNKEAIWHGGDVPGSLAVIGGGAIGVEFAQIYSRFGSRVTLLEVAERVLPPEDLDSSLAIDEALAAEGIAVMDGVEISRVTRTAEGWTVAVKGGPNVVAERLLVAAGRKPCFDGHDLEAAGVRLDDKGRPQLTETLRTTAPHIWAGGDATGDLLFTHVGGYEAGLIAADILGDPRPRDYRVVPKVTYCEPEVASVGLTEEAARGAGHEVVTGLVRMADVTRAFLEGEPFGLVKLVADEDSGELLGGHIVGEHAGELIHEVVAAMAARTPVATLGNTIHAYPSWSAGVRGAFRALAAELGEDLS